MKEGEKLTTFDEGAAVRAARKEIAQHPLTTWPIAIGLAGGFGVALLGIMSIPAAIVLGSLFTVGGAANWAVRYFGGKEDFAKKYLEEHHRQFELLRQRRVGALGEELEALDCSQGHDQVSQFEAKFQNLVDVLKRILSEGELTFGRYLGAAETVYKSGIENLDQIVTILTSIREIDRDELESKIRRLNRVSEKTEADGRLFKTFQERASLYDNAKSEVENLLVSNEEALTTLDKTAGAVGMIKKNNGGCDLDDAMADLLSLIGRINRRTSSVLVM